MLHSQVLIFGYQLAQAAGVRESMSCASRDSGFAELCERFAGSQATEFMEQLGNLGINSNNGLIVTSVFWLEQMKNQRWISVDTFCKAVAMQDMLRRADGRDWGESLRDIDLPDAAGLATQKKRARIDDAEDESTPKRFIQVVGSTRPHSSVLFQGFVSCTRSFHPFSFISFVFRLS